MPVFDVALRLNRPPTDDEIEALYEVTGGDADVEWNPDTGYGAVTFNREADTLTEAIVSAVHDVEQVPGLRVAGAGQDDLVTMLDIARRVGRTRASVRMLVNGQRGPGGFPRPALVTTGGEKVWNWPEAAAWLRDRLGVAVEVPPRTHDGRPVAGRPGRTGGGTGRADASRPGGLLRARGATGLALCVPPLD